MGLSLGLKEYILVNVRLPVSTTEVLLLLRLILLSQLLQLPNRRQLHVSEPLLVFPTREINATATSQEGVGRMK